MFNNDRTRRARLPAALRRWMPAIVSIFCFACGGGGGGGGSGPSAEIPLTQIELPEDTSLTMEARSSSSLTLSWQPARPASGTAAPTVNYRVKIASDEATLLEPGLQVAPRVVREWSAGETKVTIDELREGETVFVLVEARLDQGPSVLWPVKNFTTIDTVVPGFLGVPTVSGIGTNSFGIALPDVSENASDQSLRWRVVIARSPTFFADSRWITEPQLDSSVVTVLDWASAENRTVLAAGLAPGQDWWVGVAIQDSAGNVAASEIFTVRTADVGAPTPGSSIEVRNLQKNSVDLGWSTATDDAGSAELEYRVVRASASSEIDSIAEALADGVVIKDWEANLVELSVSGLDHSSGYAFAVLVRDAAGNSSLYGPVQISTPSESPTVTTGISIPLVGAEFVHVYWGPASDDSPAETLRYKLVKSTTAAAVGTLAAIDAAADIVVDNVARPAQPLVVSGLPANTQIWFGLVVTDPSGNRTLYSAASVRTLKALPTAGLLAWWKFDNDLTDSSGNGNHGSAVGSLSYSSTNRRIGTYAASFNGTNSWLETPLRLNGRQAFTVAGWLRTSSTTAAQVPFFGQVGFWSAGLRTNGLAKAFGADLATAISLTEAGVGAEFPTFTWVHVALSAQTQGAESGVRLWRNGSQVASSTSVPNLGGTSGSNFAIGHRVWAAAGLGSYLQGQVDEVAVWDRALSAQELSDLANP
jgi:hypothetical protein